LTDPHSPPLEFLKVEEVAALLKIREKTARRWIGRGELEAYKIGKEWRVRRDHLDAAIEARRVGGQPPAPGGLWDPTPSDDRSRQRSRARRLASSGEREIELRHRLQQVRIAGFDCGVGLLLGICALEDRPVDYLIAEP
jgi:excisionase family DNA binding protein